MSSLESCSELQNQTLPGVLAPVSYLADGATDPVTLIYPPSSGRPTVRAPAVRVEVTIRDARPIAGRLDLDGEGFTLHEAPVPFTDFYDEAAVRSLYYPRVAEDVRRLTGAARVIVFDHNTRSAVRAARGEPGVRVPVDQVHNDYTEESGPRRRLEILQGAGCPELADRPYAFVNLWRPVIGPIRDNCLTLCDARTVPMEDFVSTEIRHFGEDDLDHPRHVGRIYSVRRNPGHRWYYFSDMQPSEVLLLKCFDSRLDGRTRFMPHTAFNHPDCPAGVTPRESIEARTLVLFDR